ncbi:hypothetical protein PLICRDRAFT_32914 [Plicaturopsis crispa FD-325 SS-3]|uniref:Unplaced genomic scaffold PLICRscaffold_24, whole genome shotgun sequence n=1 Tax=Plicaturopsis crispa FD-325 SS-3 TaxID=944288 RepID=A0A0C9T5V2_PLICR|nr:hypothetical protein PLICRDRAFT_32914 [Plicaturopsis crispa FD-325 SS-3]
MDSVGRAVRFCRRFCLDDNGNAAVYKGPFCEHSKAGKRKRSLCHDEPEETPRPAPFVGLQSVRLPAPSMDPPLPMPGFHDVDMDDGSALISSLVSSLERAPCQPSPPRMQGMPFAPEGPVVLQPMTFTPQVGLDEQCAVHNADGPTYNFGGFSGGTQFSLLHTMGDVPFTFTATPTHPSTRDSFLSESRDSSQEPDILPEQVIAPPPAHVSAARLGVELYSDTASAAAGRLRAAQLAHRLRYPKKKHIFKYQTNPQSRLRRHSEHSIRILCNTKNLDILSAPYILVYISRPESILSSAGRAAGYVSSALAGALGPAGMSDVLERVHVAAQAAARSQMSSHAAVAAVNADVERVQAERIQALELAQASAARELEEERERNRELVARFAQSQIVD